MKQYFRHKIIQAQLILNQFSYFNPKAAIMNAQEDIVEYVELLLEAGADPNACDNFGYTPMTSLIKRGFRDGAVVSEKHMQVS